MKTFVFLGLLGLVAADQITSLPGAPASNFNQYSGYFKVGKNNGHNMHYWLVESQGNPSTDPVLLWLTGGPGCSGLSALLTEWGPYMVNADGATLSVNPYSWNRNATVLVLESPIGVGFSYADNGNTDTDDNQVANENWEALCEFFTTFPQFANNDFYVTGESYGGIYVPTLVQTILDNQNKQHINIKGFAIGNGCVSFPEGTDALIDFEYAHGMIDDVKWAKVRKECCKNDTDDCQFHSMNGFGFCPSFANEAANQAWYSGINPYNMYSNCYNGDGFVPKRFIHEAKFRTGLPMPEKLESVPCLDERPVTNYLNRPDVRAALFISNKSPKWEICSELNYNRIYTDMTSRVQNAIAKGLKGLLYSGDVDMACNFLMGQRFTRKLGLKQTHVKKAYNVNGQNAGYHTQYGNMAFVTARGAGHMVPTDKPAVAFHIIDSFLNNRNY